MSNTRLEKSEESNLVFRLTKKCYCPNMALKIAIEEHKR